MRPVIQTKTLSIQYGKNNPPVVCDLYLEFSQASRTALLGHNGSGKSTLLKSLLRITPATISGSIIVEGTDILQARLGELNQLRSRIGYIAQYHNLVNRSSVLTNVIYGLLGHTQSFKFTLWSQSLTSNAVRKKALEKLDQVGLADFAAKKAGELSGGQAQRVAVARALMQSPQIILADEPTASLDPVASLQVMDLLTRLAVEHKLTFIFTTHALEHAAAYSERTIILKAGKLVKDISSDQLDITDTEAIYV